jgi:D-xylose transport system ATP-binding protein
VTTASAPTSERPLLQLTGVTKRFGAVEALTDVDFDVHAGEVVALVGDNGAGKSTLIKAIAGIQPGDEYEATWDGESVHLNTPQDAGKLGIATVYQDLALCDNLDVVANLFLGQEQVEDGITGAARTLDEIEMEQRSVDLLRQLAVRTLRSVRTEVGMLSGGQRQTVAIARSMLGQPKIVLLDEPTAALGVAQTRQVLDLVRRLADRGLGVVLISHNMGDVFEVADRITALYLGRVAADVPAKDVSHSQVVELITAGRSGDLGIAENPATAAV